MSVETVEQRPAAQQSSTLTRMLRTCADIGGIYSLSYSEAIILTSDAMKAKHGGIPQGGWLLAAATNTDSEGKLALKDEEIILLRVRAVTPLPHERDLVAGRLAVVADAHAGDVDYHDVVDVHTRAQHEQSAFVADVVGVFYTDSETGRAEFGAELDNVWAAAKYRVFQPSEKALSWIASFPRSADALAIGTVRFSATMRNARETGRDKAVVSVNVADFVGRKTAVLGITRGGKSNTIKTLVTAVYQFAAERQRSIGQIIFDPQGEYAKVNDQDKTGLRLLGDDDHVAIYTSKPDPGESKEHPLRLNFYDLDLFEAAWEMVVGAMEGAEANYVRTFRSADMERPDANDYSAQTHWGRGHMAFYGLLYRAGYKGDFANGATLTFAMKDEAAEKFNKENKRLKLSGGSGTYTVSSPEQAAAVVDWINTKIGVMDKLDKSNKDEDAEAAEALRELIGKWLESDQFTAVADVFKYAKGRGLAGLRELREFHDPSGDGDVNEMVWDDMLNGRLVIIDLSVGSTAVTKTMSERLIDALVNKASERFREGQGTLPFQVVVEEAHNLFERGRDARHDPWVRMSKEAAKYDIGLVYATQEVTSVDQRILSNTQNWVVAHFNSDIEIRELAKYYNFGDFGDSIKRAEEPGYVRMKTLSNPFIVPTQIRMFDHDMINRARAAAGLAPAKLPGDESAPAPVTKTKTRGSTRKKRTVTGDGEF